MTHHGYTRGSSINIADGYYRNKFRNDDSISNTYVIVVSVIFEDCKLFRDVALSKSLSRAAQTNGISQSAATQHIQDLERRLGVPLLDRSTRPLALTPAGKLYADLCRDVLRREEQFAAELQELTAEVEGTVRVASIYSIGLSEMRRLRTEFEQACAGAQLAIEYLRPGKVYDAVLEDRADLGFVSYPEHRRELTVIDWRDEKMSVAVYPSHRFARRKHVLPGDLEGERFIAFDEDVTIRRELDRFLRDQEVTVEVAMQFDNIQSIKEAVALGSGISILPERTMQVELDSDRLISVALEAPGLVRPVGIIHRKRKKLNRAARQFLDLVLEESSARTLA